MIDQHLHPFHRVHVPASVNIYCAGSRLRKGVNTEVRLRQGIHNRDTLRMKLVGESVEDRGSAHFDGTFERGFDSCKIIQQIERDAIKAD